MRKINILYYTPYFKQRLSEAIGFSPSQAEDMCTITEDLSKLKEADVVLFHIPNVLRLPKKRTGQLWVAMSMESDANYPLQCDPYFMRNFDITMNFRSNADVQMLYFDATYHLPVLKEPAKPKYREAPAVYFASNNYALNNRFELVSELMQHMKIDSYGKSQNNCLLGNDTGRMSKLDRIAGYHFYLAFENSNSVDYVSEKMFDGLIAGSVPVYLGAPNIDEYLPADKCIIKVSDFGSPSELAQFLLSLIKDVAEYESYLAWKNKPLRDSFITKIQPEYTPAIRRLCSKIIELTSANKVK